MSLTAVYNYPENGYRPATQLEVGKEDIVDSVDMGNFYTYIYLSGIDGCFNSVQFDFFEGGEPIDIYRSPKYNPYLQRRSQK